MTARDQTNTEIVVDLDEADKPAPAVVIPEGVDAVETEAEDIKKLPKGAILNENGSVTLPLLYPRSVTIKGQGGVREERFDEFLFHRLNGADINAIRAASKETSHIVALARSLHKHVAIIKALYDKLDSADITRAGEVLDSFF
jgi:hypothetical protein